jgi:hypothetical protein
MKREREREREGELPGAGTVAAVRLRLVVLFSEVGGLDVVSFSVEDSFIGLRVHGL